MLNLGFVFIEFSSSVKFVGKFRLGILMTTMRTPVAVEPMTSVLAATGVAQSLRPNFTPVAAIVCAALERRDSDHITSLAAARHRAGCQMLRDFSRPLGAAIFC
jgi:hypothetical protein